MYQLSYLIHAKITVSYIVPSVKAGTQPQSGSGCFCFSKLTLLDSGVLISAFSGLRQKANEDRAVAIRGRLTVNEKGYSTRPLEGRVHVTLRAAIPIRFACAARHTTRVFREKTAKNTSSFRWVCTEQVT